MKKLLGLIIKVVVAVVVAIFAIISIVAGNIVTFGMHDYAREVDVRMESHHLYLLSASIMAFAYIRRDMPRN